MPIPYTLYTYVQDVQYLHWFFQWNELNSEDIELLGECLWTLPKLARKKKSKSDILKLITDQIELKHSHHVWYSIVNNTLRIENKYIFIYQFQCAKNQLKMNFCRQMHSLDGRRVVDVNDNTSNSNAKIHIADGIEKSVEFICVHIIVVYSQPTMSTMPTKKIN